MFHQKNPDLRRYEKTVLKYEAKPIETGRILFYGSSGFGRWKAAHGNRPLEEDIRMKDGSPAAVNHGFGGSTMEEGLYYYDRLVKPWEPRAIVLRFFPNDVSSGYTPEEIVYLHSLFCHRAAADFPGIRFFICDAMPHQKYVNNKLWQTIAKRYNRLISEYCDSREDCTLVAQSRFPGFYPDPEKIGDYSAIRQDIWLEDRLHFTQKGYDLYRDLFLNALNELL
jgi:hypothetical protein